MERLSLVRASGCSNMPNSRRNDILDLQRALSMKISVGIGRIYNQMTMEEILERICEVSIIDEMDCFRFDFIEKMN